MPLPGVLRIHRSYVAFSSCFPIVSYSKLVAHGKRSLSSRDEENRAVVIDDRKLQDDALRIWRQAGCRRMQGACLFMCTGAMATLGDRAA